MAQWIPRPSGWKAWLIGGTLLGASLAFLAALPCEDALPVAVAQAPQQVTPVVAQPAAEAPLDGPLRMIADAKQIYLRHADYTCMLVTQERVKGQLKPENVIAMHFRNQPFSVYMKWLGPKDMAGQEVCFVANKNNGKMRVHAKGLGNILGFISLDVNDPRVMEHSRHTIHEAGLWHMMDKLGKDLEAEKRYNKTVVRYGEYEYNKRRCTRMEMVRNERNQVFNCFRTVVYFDKETRLPVRLECYDWPRQGGPPEGDLLESFSYVDLRFDVGLTEQFFNK